MHFLSICAVVLDERSYIEEWLSWHLIHGISHFYLYDNGSTDGTKEIYERYKDVVTWYDWSTIHPIQFDAYNDCINKHRKDTEWCAFIDTDEFLSTTMSSLPFAIQTLTRGKKIGAVAAHWVYFGSNGHKEKTPGLVIERFTKSQQGANRHVKSIVNMMWAKSVGKDPHTFYTHGTVIDENGMTLEKDYAKSEPCSSEFLWINHYHTKSWEEYQKRKSRPDSGTGKKYSADKVKEKFDAHDINFCEDLWAMERAEKVKAELRKRNTPVVPAISPSLKGGLTQKPSESMK